MAGITFLIVALIVAFTWVTKVSAGTISTSAVSLNDAILIDVSRQVVHQLRHPKGRSYRWISNGSDVGQGNSTRRAQYASELKQVTKKHTNNQRSPSPPPTVTQHPLTSQRDHEQNPLKTADDDYNSWMKPSPAVQHQNDGKPTTSIFVVIPLIISMITFIVGVFMAIYALHRCGQVALRTHRGGGRRRNQAATASNGSDAPEERQRGEVAKDARIRYILNHLEITVSFFLCA